MSKEINSVYDYMHCDIEAELRKEVSGRDYEGITTVPTALLIEAYEKLRWYREREILNAN